MTYDKKKLTERLSNSVMTRVLSRTNKMPNGRKNQFWHGGREFLTGRAP